MQPLEIIKLALNSTIGLINKGSKPTDALEKTAREFDLNPNYIQRTGEALNVALFYGHMKTASDRASDFDTGDINTVIGNIFGEKEKTAAELRAEWFPSVNEDVDYNKYLTNPGFKKAAEAIKNTPENYDSFGITYKGQYKKAQDYISRLDRDLDEIKTEKVANDTYLEASLFNLINTFKKEASYRTPFHEFESQAFATHGTRAVPYIDLIYKSAGLTESRGSRDSKYISFEPCKELNYFDSLLKSASNKPKLQADLDEAVKLVSEQRGQFKQAGYKLNPFAAALDKAACDKFADELDTLVAAYPPDEVEKTGSDIPKPVGIGGSILGTLYNLSKDKADSVVGDAPGSYNFQNTDLDNRARAALLQNLILTDDVLKTENPYKIVNAYQQILRLAPQLSKEQEVVRAKLREMMAGQALHPTDAGQLVDLNTDLLKQHALLQAPKHSIKPLNDTEKKK
jgi:hypothetical protein